MCAESSLASGSADAWIGKGETIQERGDRQGERRDVVERGQRGYERRLWFVERSSPYALTYVEVEAK